jgi:hypothetical protein
MGLVGVLASAPEPVGRVESESILREVTSDKGNSARLFRDFDDETIGVMDLISQESAADSRPEPLLDHLVLDRYRHAM